MASMTPGSFLLKRRLAAALMAAATSLAASHLFADDSSPAKPSYLQPFTDDASGMRIVRITGDPGSPLQHVEGTWGKDARHVYSKQQPWSADQKLFFVENSKGGKPSQLLLDGTTFAPVAALCEASALYDSRWHPSREHASERIGVDRDGRRLAWVNVLSCRVTRSWDLPLEVDGIGSGEGNPSRDGRFVALGKGKSLFVVDMDPRPPFAPYPARRIGPVYRLPDPGFGSDMPVDNISVSPSGRYVDVNYAGDTPETQDLHRILEVDPKTLELRPHRMAEGSLRCAPVRGQNEGWIFPAKHADMATDPADGEDVMVGGLACPGSSMGHVVKIRLKDGRVTALTEGGDEASVSHVSARNLERPGWVYVTYFYQHGKDGSDEIVALPLDGDGSPETWAHTLTASPGCYRCEAHAVPSPDGRRVAFASNWRGPGGRGSDGDAIEDYVVTRR